MAYCNLLRSVPGGARARGPRDCVRTGAGRRAGHDMLGSPERSRLSRRGAPLCRGPSRAAEPPGCQAPPPPPLHKHCLVPAQTQEPFSPFLQGSSCGHCLVEARGPSDRRSPDFQRGAGGGGGGLGSANAETTPARAPAAAADRRQRPDAAHEGKVQGPVKEQQPDGMSHGGTPGAMAHPIPPENGAIALF